MLSALGLLLSLLISYSIADIFYGGWDKHFQTAAEVKKSFRLVITPYQKKVLKLAILLAPFVFSLAALLYRLWQEKIISQ